MELTLNIAVSFNKKYVKYAVVMLTSFCENNPGEHSIFILHEELEKEDFDIIRTSLEHYGTEIIPICVSDDVKNLKLPTTSDWSNEIYFRLLLAEKLPKKTDRIFYFDVDTIIHGSLAKLYNSDFQGADLIAAIDSNNTGNWNSYSPKVQSMLRGLYQDKFLYFNSGVLLMNISQMRDKYSFSYYLKAMEEWNYEMTAPDQDILNYVHACKVKYMPWEEYDLFAKIAYNNGWTYNDVKEKNKILHFAGAKPWKFDSTRYELEKFWWEYAAKTPVYKKLREEYLSDAMNNPKLENEIQRLLFF